AFRSTRFHLLQAWLSPCLSRRARRGRLYGFLWRNFRCHLRRVLARFSAFRPRRLSVAKMNRRVRTPGALARSKSRNRPNRLDARSRRRHLLNRPLPLHPDLVAIVYRTIDARLRQFRRGQRRILRKLSFLGEQGVDLLLDLLLTLGIQEFFARQKLFIERDGVARLPIRAHL